MMIGPLKMLCIDGIVGKPSYPKVVTLKEVVVILMQRFRSFLLFSFLS